jgi:hypothetical protein
MNPHDENAFDELLRDGLAVPEESKENVMSELSIALARQTGPADTFGSKLLAAGVFLALGVGLLYIAKPPAHQTTGGQSSAVNAPERERTVGDDKKEPPPSDQKPLPPDQQKKVDALLKQMDSDKYAERAAAQRELIGMGLSVRPYLMQKLNEKAKLSAEVLSGLQSVVAAIDAQERDKKIKAALADLDKAVAEAPALYQEPSPEVMEKLNKKIAFEFADKPLQEALAYISKEAGVAICLDPQAEKNAVPIFLRVENMSCDKALQWVCKLTETGFAIRNGAVVVTSQDRAQKLNLRAFNIDLPVREGEAPWTLAETEAFAELLRELPLKADFHLPLNVLNVDWDVKHNLKNTFILSWTKYESMLLKTVAPGKLLRHDDASNANVYDAFLKQFAVGRTDMEKVIAENVNTAATVWTGFEPPDEKNIDPMPCVVDLAPLIKAGHKPEDLKRALANFGGTLLRARYVFTATPETAARVNKLLDEAIKTGKLPEK